MFSFSLTCKVTKRLEVYLSCIKKILSDL
ncbi:hypothetical protein OCT59_009602 [Rhizophagus irregularis]|nr:hypothetical protein OCT59_009602 [Rhizophagus irregularis]